MIRRFYDWTIIIKPDGDRYYFEAFPPVICPLSKQVNEQFPRANSKTYTTEVGALRAAKRWLLRWGAESVLFDIVDDWSEKESKKKGR